MIKTFNMRHGRELIITIYDDYESVEIGVDDTSYYVWGGSTKKELAEFLKELLEELE